MRNWPLLAALLALCAGCGTTRWSDTQRTATEQLLITDAMDRAVNRLDFKPLSGKNVYLDPLAIKGLVDAPYLASSIRQQMMAHGCIVEDKREDADYVVEVRAGAIGTDHREVLFGIPATRVPEVGAMASVPSVPEVPLAKKTEQRAVAKIALFAYNRESSRPVWQSGTVPIESTMKDLWVLGAGPYQRGSIVINKAGLAKKSSPPVLLPGEKIEGKRQLAVTDEARFIEPLDGLARRKKSSSKEDEVAHAGGKKEAESRGSSSDRKDDKTEGKSAKQAEPPGPLDAVVPASHQEPAGSISAQPNSGTDGFWPLPASSSSQAPVAPLPPSSTTPATTSPAASGPTAPASSGSPPTSGWQHGMSSKAR